MTRGLDDTANPDLLVHAAARAEEAARAGGDAALAYFRDPDLTVETKGDGSHVSPADREAEAAVRDVLAADPRLGACDVLGEEHGETGTGTALRWVIDPIDGTFLFINGVPQWGTLVALEDVAARRPLVGIVHLPAIGLCYTAIPTYRAGAISFGSWVPNAGAPHSKRIAPARYMGSGQDALAAAGGEAHPVRERVIVGGMVLPPVLFIARPCVNPPKTARVRRQRTWARRGSFRAPGTGWSRLESRRAFAELRGRETRLA